MPRIGANIPSSILNGDVTFQALILSTDIFHSYGQRVTELILICHHIFRLRFIFTQLFARCTVIDEDLAGSVRCINS